MAQRTHSLPSELMAQEWLRALPELHGMAIYAGWIDLPASEGSISMITISDTLHDLEPTATMNWVQIDVWSPDQAESLAAIIWAAAAENDSIDRMMYPRFVPNQGGRWTLDLAFREPD